ncbi:MAG: c-type cytochrome [Nitrospinae bacterium]|nr:c-type cytochrome [Nitrospinota bacterium]
MNCKKPFLILNILFLFMLSLSLNVLSVWADDNQKAKEIIQNQCSTCHKFEGEPESKFKLKGPDLMWAGNKYQRPWLIRWLTGKEENLYPKGYRWDLSQKQIQHPTLSKADANSVADYFSKHYLDSRIKKSFVDLSTLTEREAQFGADIFRKFSCIGCHQIKEDGKKIGGPISTNLYDAGNRYNLDWWSRFAENPQDFTPHSGEYLADLSMLGARYIIGYLMTLGVDDFKYYEPWTSQEFKKTNIKNGARVYQEYCRQCHGSEGKGDGPGASGLKPKPAVHAQMALSDFPEDYLYNVIYHGGKAVGKSPNMPDWGLTLPTQDIADVIAFLRDTFQGGEASAPAATPQMAKSSSKGCVQKRKTRNAPASYQTKKNPLPVSQAHIQAGKALFMKEAKPVPCKMCHGKKGNGKGPGAGGMNPRPRDFTCSSMMNDIPDGQLFWIVKNGSPGTGMMAFRKLKDDQIWQLVHYLRTLAK